VVTDLGSTNGTRVNGIPVREQHLATGDEVTVGSTTLVYESF
jgi:pSer/pThr/pTyr-binding forkhead associated (FHA) protein